MTGPISGRPIFPEYERAGQSEDPIKTQMQVYIGQLPEMLKEFKTIYNIIFFSKTQPTSDPFLGVSSNANIYAVPNEEGAQAIINGIVNDIDTLSAQHDRLNAMLSYVENLLDRQDILLPKDVLDTLTADQTTIKKVLAQLDDIISTLRNLSVEAKQYKPEFGNNTLYYCVVGELNGANWLPNLQASEAQYMGGPGGQPPGMLEKLLDQLKSEWNK